MGEAIALAKRYSPDGRHGPFGAVVARGGEVVGRGWNRVVDHRDPTAHAEVEAIRDAGRNLQTHILGGCDLYTSCEPCPMCMAAIYWARIRSVWYACTAEDAAAAGFDDVFIRNELRVPAASRKLPLRQVGREDGLAVFKEWRENPDRVPY